MNRKISKVGAMVAVSLFFGATISYAVPTLDNYTGVEADSIYHDTGASYVSMTDLTDPTSATHMIEYGISSTVDYEYQIGMFDYFAPENTLIVLDTYDGANITINNVHVYTDTHTVESDATGETASMGTTWGYFLNVYGTYQGYENPVFYSDTSVGGEDLDIFGFFNDPGGISSIGYDETAMTLGFPTIDGEPSPYLVVGINDVAPVPEPASMFLLGTGLVGLVGASRKRKARFLQS
ncbi:MAG: PEP-CTERM sorting domain-containing protein [Desulfobulbaceae bacterium]|nr:PEP-CTERM sorting domain-containing protein [Desulfobulbaceae bacterium]